mgnify:FL=1
MKKDFFNKFNFRFFILIVIIFFSKLTLSFSENIKSINITGNERLSNETILLFSELDINKDLNVNDLNEAIKKLYQTDYFEDIKMLIENGVLKISVLENPIIQTITINGIKNKSILDKINEITKKSEKYPFLIHKISDQKNLLLNIVRANGFYFAKIDTKIKDNKNNSVDIIYDFDLKQRAKIQKINFIGKKIFKDSKLRNLIVSEENKPWKFITINKYLDQSRIDLDKNLLKNYYKSKGYYNVIIKSSTAKVINNDNFELTFNIDSGEKYFFNKVSLNVSDQYDRESFLVFDSIFKKLEGETYSLNSINKIIKEIDKIALQKEFVFINAMYNETIIDNNKINIEIFFDELEKTFVEQINIFGNFITEEKVIRNSLIVDEGDPYNKILFNKSINKIKGKNIFQSVETKITEKDKNNKIIDIIIEEKATGEIFAGAGTGTSGTTLGGGIKENNYLGRGIILDTNFSISEEEIKGRFKIINPNFKNSDKSLNTIIESTNADYMAISGYKTSRTGFNIGTGFEQYSNVFVNLDLSNYYEKLETSDSASAIKKKQEGDYFENLLSYSVSLNSLDQNFQPTEGSLAKFSQVLPLYSDDNTIENTFNFSKYYSPTDNLVLSGKLFMRAVNSIDDNVRVSKRVYIPSSKLRGFEAGKIGPKDGAEYIGGNYGTALNFNSTLPNILSGFENIDLSIFLDAANIWEVDYDSSLDSSKIRSSTGVAVNWFTPVGPLSFSYAIPLSEASSDKTESFRFRLGTSF